MNEEQVSIVLNTSQGVSCEAAINCFVWTKDMALKKAMRWGGTLFVIGLILLPLPLLHIAGVLLILLATPIVSIFVYKMHLGGKDLKGEAPCPACQAPLKLYILADRLPAQEICQNCSCPLNITLKEGKTGT